MSHMTSHIYIFYFKLLNCAIYYVCIYNILFLYNTFMGSIFLFICGYILSLLFDVGGGTVYYIYIIYIYVCGDTAACWVL